METAQKNLDEIGIGTKETQALPPKDVKVLSHKIEAIPSKKEGEKNIGEKVILICKHPDREEPIEMSRVAYLKGKTVTCSGLWFNLDDDKLIPKQSALAIAMRHFGIKTVKEFDGDYLVIKAY